MNVATLSALRALASCALGCAVLLGCTAHVPAPIEQKSTTQGAPRPVAKASDRTRTSAPAHAPGGTYRVAAGDTLYAIAWRFGVDYRELAKWNGISDPHRIYVGQRLHLSPAGASRSSVASPPPARAMASGAEARAATVPAPKVISTAPSVQVAAPSPQPANETRTWVWPADGKAQRAVSATGSIGLEIKGTRGQPIRAASDGQVVYAGNGLRGYGQLLIVKHDENFLSAYAHNDKLLVSEGQRIEIGQPIALMGDTEADEVMLHFEIRKGGKAVEPLQYLPQR